MEGSSILGGITSFWGEKKRGSVVTENPKGGTTQISLKNEDVGGGGIPKVIKSY